MKKLTSKKLIVILILVLLAVFAFVIGIVILYKTDNKGNDKDNDNKKEYYSNTRYNYTGKIKEPEGTVVVKNNAMSKEHCLNDICVSDATFYSNDEMGRVDCTVTNKKLKKVTGYLKLNFGNNSLIIMYKDLEPGKSTKTSAQFFDMDFGKVEDYTLQELTDEDLKNIVS